MAEKIVRARFELDDHASKVLEHIRGGFEHVEEKAKVVGHEIAGVFKTALGTAFGFQLSGALETVKGFGEEVYEAAAGMGAMEKGIRGVLMMTDKEGTSLEEMTAQAHELNESFTGMAVETGASKEQIVSAFDSMAERTGMTTENVEKLTREMAQAGRAVPGGIGALSEGFSNLSSGIVRARNPLVQLIAATGVLHGNAKAVAAQLLKMSPEKAMQLGIDAVEKMSGKMAAVPLSFGETIASMKALREEIFESLGAPILAALGGPLHELRDYFRENKEEIQKWAQATGKDAGEWLKGVAGNIKDGFEYLRAHSAEIKADIIAAMRFVRDTVEFIIEHRQALMLAWGASKVPAVVGAVSGAAGGARAAGSAVMSVGKMLAGVGGAGAAVAPEAGAAAKMLEGGALAATSATKSFAAEMEVLRRGIEGEAVAARGLGYQLTGSGLAKSAQDVVVAESGFIASTKTVTQGVSIFGTTVGTTTASIAGLGAAAVAAGAIALAVNEGKKLGDITGGNGGAGYRPFMSEGQMDIEATKKRAQESAAAGDVEQTNMMLNRLKVMQHDVDVAYLDITDNEIEAIETMVETVSGAARKAAADAGAAVLDPQLSAYEATKRNRKADIEYAKKQSGVGTEGTTSTVTNNFHGGIQIHQDFKNVDPDRIALVFTRHFAQATQAKAMAATQAAHTAF